jgi:hypothetical protein
MLTTAARQSDQLCADRLRDGIQLALAQMRLEEFHVCAFHADDGEARPSFSFAHVPALTYKDFCHILDLFPVLFWAYTQNNYTP